MPTALKDSAMRITPDSREYAVLIGPFPPPVHGASMVNSKLSQFLTQRGVSVRAFNIAPYTYEKGPLYHLSRLQRFVKTAIGILPISRHEPFLINVDGGFGILYNIFLAGLVRVKNARLALYHHSSRYIYERSKLVAILVAVCGKKTLHVACSAKMLSEFQTRYGDLSHTIVISNAAWVESGVHASDEIASTSIRLGFLSNLDPEKGVFRAIDTLRQLRRGGHDATLVVAGSMPGSGEGPDFDELEREFGSNLSYLGKIGGEEKSNFFNNLDYFLFPSLYRHETQSLVVSEALSYGVPVVTFDHMFVKELLGVGGIAIEKNMPFADEAAKWIAHGKESPEVYVQRQNNAHKSFEMNAIEAKSQITRLLDWFQT